MIDKEYRIKRKEFIALTNPQMDVVIHVTGNISSDELDKAQERIAQIQRDLDNLQRQLESTTNALHETVAQLKRAEIALFEECKSVLELLEEDGVSL